jgi:hypothetical protein
MHEEYSNFLKVLGSVSRYSCDGSLTEDYEDELQKPFHISTNDFLFGLYEKRSVESTIKDKLRKSADLICLVGPRGCGKTSIGLKVKHDLEELLYFVVFVDVRMDEAMKNLRFGTERELYSAMRSRIIAEYKAKLFPMYHTTETQNPRLQLYAFLLDYRSIEEKPFALFHTLQDSADTAVRLFDTWVAGRPKERQGKDYYDWLADTYKTEPKIEDLLNGLESIIDIPHLAYASRYVHEHHRQVIWFDNIDALPDELQLEAVEILKTFLHTTSKYVSFIMSVREENVFKESKLSDEGAPPYDVRVMVEIPRNIAGRAVYPGVDVPVVKMSTLREIITKRMTYTKKYQQEAIRTISERIKKRKAELEATESTDRKEYIQKRIKMDEIELGDFQPPITLGRFSNLQTLSDRIISVMESERATYIANNSVRDLLYIHRDFLSHLLKSPNKNAEPPQALSYEHWYIATLFLTWIRHTERRYKVGMYDLIADCQSWYRTPKSRIGCLLPHLILTTIWNRCLETKTVHGKRWSLVSVEDVVVRLSKIGYNPTEILECMFSLCYQDGSRGHFLEFRLREDLTSSSQIRNHHKVRITYRGKAFACFVSSSFGYLHECIRHLCCPTTELLNHPEIRQTEQHVFDMLPYLCDLAQMHFTEFKRIVESGDLGRTGETLDEYLRRFGIPQESPYARREPVGRLYGEGRRALLLQSILSSIGGYLQKPGEVRNKLVELERLFTTAMEGVDKQDKPGRPADEVNFRESLGLPPRT